MSSKFETTDRSTADTTANRTRTPWRRGSRLTATATAALACALAAGCLAIDDPEALQGSDERADIDSELLDDGIAASEISVNYHVSASPWWYQGNAPVILGSINDVFCFLTDVQGRFEGGGEVVKVYQEGGWWKLGGQSYQEGVGGRAACIPLNYKGQTLTVSKEYSWDQSSLATYMGSAANRVCLLTHVSGEFDGGAERVEAFIDGSGSWQLTGSGARPGIAAKAHCVNTSSRSGPHHWDQNLAPQPISLANGWTCGLTRMRGGFEGGGERVSVHVSGTWWYLDGSSLQSGVAATAYCL
jgi:hypothetical protein